LDKTSIHTQINHQAWTAINIKHRTDKYQAQDW